MHRFICKEKLSPECKGYEDVPSKVSLSRMKMCWLCRCVFEKEMRKKYKKKYRA